ncbi:MAG: GntR family transcriptional regulator [Lactobacillus sp.]|jgi:GntR family transcriptional regulator of arabinose operon|nr:GntR family transcriptional regulator [Lactobacillus sp.]MCI2032460.1 GntR family transcriptional regulator [Lactobacillus sp.]
MEKKYQTVNRVIQSWIADGEYKENEKLPTESDLMKRFEVSRHTVRKALADLETDGIVYRIQGGGTYVRGLEPRLPKLAERNAVGVMATHLNDYIFPSIIAGIERILSQDATSLVLSSTQNDEMIEAQSITKLSNINGLIVEPARSAFIIKNEPRFAELSAQNIPIVTINAKFKQLATPYFVMDDFSGGKLAAEYILKNNHRHILGIFKNDDQQGVDRLEGFTYALQAFDIEDVTATLFYQSSTPQEKIGAKLQSILSGADRPTAIVCYNDQMAVLAYNTAQTLGVKVPQDLSIIGFDNSSLASGYGLHLTSVNHPKAQMGEDAADLILKMIKEPNKEFMNMSKVYAPELVIGDSVRRLPDSE